MNNLKFSFLIWGLVFLIAGQSFAETEEWKGKANEQEFTMGAMTGLGLYNGNAGFTLIGHLAKKIVDQGFVPEINNQVFAEVEVGPLFVLGSVAWMYGLHLRWDFIRDETWTIFALGGVGGSITSSSIDNSFRIAPRFGIGSLYAISDQWKIRAELSHNLILAGFSFGY
jgi:hypothetical protein